MKKRILSLLLALVMVIGMVPFVAMAGGQETDLGTVYISVSDDAEFVTDLEGNPMGFVAVPLEELAEIDLADFYLEDYIYDADGDGMQEITALHLYIYVHELLLGHDWSEVYVTGGPGSIYLADGLFGFSDENLRYDLNGSYPIDEQLSQEWGYSVGATADRIVLKDGDFLNVAHYSSWAFWGDSATGFHYFTNKQGVLQHTYQTLPGESLKLGLVRSFSDWSNGGNAAFAPEVGYEIYYGKTYGEPEGMVYSNEEGMAEVTFPTAGTWYVWANGGYGMENCTEIVSAPALAMVKVADLEFSLDLSGLTDSIYSGGIITYTQEKPDEFAYLDDTAEAGKVIKYAFGAEDYDTYILYVDFYADSNILGFNVNGTNYFAEDPGSGYVDLDMGNDVWTGYAFGYEDENGRAYTEFYLHLGVENAYNTSGKWVITPILLTDEILAVIDAIDSIEEVTLESGNDIACAWELYNALSDGEKEVADYFGALEILEEVQAIYDVLRVDQDAADEVAERIGAIGEVDLSKETAIAAARAAYDALSEARQALVGNYADLVAAEERLQQMKEEAQQAIIDQAAADAVKDKIAAIGTVSVFSDKKIKTARDAYDALSDAQKKLVENTAVLDEAEQTLAELYAAASQVDPEKIFKDTGTYLSQLGTPNVGSTGGEWMVIDLVRSGLPCSAGYYENVAKFVRENINDKEQLHRVKSTENSRLILALTAAGYDVTDVDGHNLLMGLTDMTYLPKQGINGPIWALIAFDCYNYEIPANPNAEEQATREKLIAYILTAQLSDGGWAMAGQTADPDMTGMAIQALAPYYKTNAEVKTAVDKALACLSDMQYDNGGFGSIDGTCSESCAQVIVALTALGIDPETDPRFVKNGMSVVDAMCLYAVENGGFAHVPNGGINGMATEQCQYALAAYFRFKEGKTSLYDMTDVTVRVEGDGPAQTGESSFVMIVVALTAGSAVCLAVLMLSKKKRYAD